MELSEKTVKKSFKKTTGLGVSEFRVELGNIIIIPKKQLLDVEDLELITKFVRDNFSTVGNFRHKLPTFQPVFNQCGGIELGLRISETAFKAK